MNCDNGQPKKILFICTGNSARSVMAEAIINDIGGGGYIAYSAGANPSGKVHPFTLETLRKYNHSIDKLRSKPLKEFLDRDIDIVVTVCDQAKESCPVWPQKTTVYHWGFEDPAGFEGTNEKKLKFFDTIYGQIKVRLEDFLKG